MPDGIVVHLDPDEARERRIEAARRRLLAASTREERGAAARDMERDIRARSARQVARMERERGLG